MVWLLGGYMWLYIHRPFEVWPVLGDLQVERLYMVFTLLCWLFCPGKGWVGNRLHAAFAAFTIILVLCWMASPYPDEGAKTVEDFFKVAVFYLLVVTTVRDERTLRTLVLFYLVAVGLYATHSLVEFAHGRHAYRMGIRRMLGVDQTYGDPNTFAATFLYSLPLTAPFWAGEARRWARVLLGYYTGISILCILLTGSRAGLIGLCCLGGQRAWASQRRGKFVLLLVLALPVGWSLLPEELRGRFETLVNAKAGPANAQESGAGRLKGFLAGLELWGRSPVTGFGPHAFGKATGKGFQAHNLLGQTLGELGSLGLLALGGMLLGFAANAREVRRLGRALPPGGEFSRRLAQAVSVSVWMLLLLGLSGHNLYRYSWMWFGAFQLIALHGLRARAAAVSQECHDALPGGDNGGWLPAPAGGDALAGGWDPDLRAV